MQILMQILLLILLQIQKLILILILLLLLIVLLILLLIQLLILILKPITRFCAYISTPAAAHTPVVHATSTDRQTPTRPAQGKGLLIKVLVMQDSG